MKLVSRTAFAAFAMVAPQLIVACSAANEAGVSDESALTSCGGPIAVKKAKASEQEKENPASKAVDGNVETRWSGEGKGSSITLDLGETKGLCGVAIAWYKGDKRKSKFEIAIGDNTDDLTTVFSGESGGKSDQAETYRFSDTAKGGGKKKNKKKDAGGTGSAGNQADASAVADAGDNSEADSGDEDNGGSAGSGAGAGAGTGGGATIGVATGRYVRITVNGNTQNNWASISEVQVLGAGGSVDPDPVDSGTEDTGTVEQDSGGGGGGEGVDEDGIKMMFPQKSGHPSWRLGDKDPNDDEEFEIERNDKTVKNGDFWTGTAHIGSLRSGGKQHTYRLHINVKESKGTQISDHKKMAEQGYMVSEMDLRNIEATGYFRFHSIQEKNEGIVTKLRGGSHSDDNGGAKSACMGALVVYDDSTTELWERELFHPKTPRFKVQKEANSDHEFLEDKWIGVKTVVYNVNGDKEAKTISYIDTDPFTADGKPANNWRKVFEFVDKGQKGSGEKSPMAVTWGGKLVSFRIDKAKTVDFKLLSAREIEPPTE